MRLSALRENGYAHLTPFVEGHHLLSQLTVILCPFHLRPAFKKIPFPLVLNSKFLSCSSLRGGGTLEMLGFFPSLNSVVA